MTATEVRCTVADVRACGLCVRGMREWAAQHGFDFNDFVRNGLPVDALEATGDHFALRACAAARQRAGGKA